MNSNEKLAVDAKIASGKHTATIDAIEEFAMLNGTEIVEQRGECEKVYDLGKGRRQAIMFAAPVHYKDGCIMNSRRKPWNLRTMHLVCACRRRF